MNNKQKVTLVECPRDAMQGIHEWIPTELKIQYLNKLLNVGFDVLDFGSFVSPQAIPQLKDTAEVLENLQTGDTQLLAIVANTRGAEQACQYQSIRYLGFPLSISETFQQRNTHKSIEQAIDTVKDIQNLCMKHGKGQVVYISMGFGNPYGDPYDQAIVLEFVERLKALGVEIISLADTVGKANPEEIRSMFEVVLPAFPTVEFGAHLHATVQGASAKLEAAWDGGCRRFDGALMGFGGCPMAGDELVGNIDTLEILKLLKSKNHAQDIHEAALEEALSLAPLVFNR